MRGGEKNIHLLRLGECPGPVAVAVGSGGEGNSGGGGSGYVAHSVDFPAAAYVKMIALVGNSSSQLGDSYVKDVDTDSMIVFGEKGKDGETRGDGGGGQVGDSCAGGAGYCGGGGVRLPPSQGGGGTYPCGGGGGSDGSDGVGCGIAGVGSNLNVSTIPLINFKLAPGEGGTGDGTGWYGGGGGGLLVDENGPPRPDLRIGQGFGGGGAASDGLPGVVLLDLVPQE